VNCGGGKVSKAALIGALLSVGLLDPSPTVPGSATVARTGRWPLAVSRPHGSLGPWTCTNPRRELRFEMIRSQTEAYSPPAPRPVCLAVFRP
jgi:hypothetical protein